MKSWKRVSKTGFLAVALSACFNPPEYSVIPEITFEDIYFQDARSIGEQESLVITVGYRDGNGDLGLSATQIDPPFHDMNFFLGSEGIVSPVEKRTMINSLPQLLDVQGNARGKLVTNRTANEADYSGTLPPYIDATSSCTQYQYTTVYVAEEHKQVFDVSYNVIDTITLNNFQPVYVLQDTFYYQRNPGYANIDVEFLVKDGSAFEPFDWEKEFCTISFNQRFPVLSEKSGPIAGDLSYALVSNGISAVLGNATLKLRVKIRDRALNVSNVIETGEFTLEKIRK